MRKVNFLIFICLVLYLLLPGCAQKLPDNEWVEIPLNINAFDYSFNMTGGKLYIAYHLFKANVEMYDSAQWEKYGNQDFSVGKAEGIQLASENGWFYVAFYDKAVGQGIVMKFQEGIWERVGKTGYFSTGEVSNISIIVLDQVPYISYRDKAVDKFKIVKVEGDGFTFLDEVPLAESESIESLQLAAKGQDIYMLYSVNAPAHKIKVMKLDGINWSEVGEYSFNRDIYSFSLDVGDYQILIAVSSDDCVHVIKFDGQSWSSLPDPGIVYTPFSIPGGGLYYEAPTVVSLSVGNGQVYLLYGDYDRNLLASVKRFNGLNWENIGVQGFSNKAIRDGRVICDTNKIYVCFLEPWFDSYLDPGKVKVFRYVSTR